jgi:hypothetical protein
MDPERLLRRLWAGVPPSTRSELYPLLRPIYSFGRSLLELSRSLAPLDAALLRGPLLRDRQTELSAMLIGSAQDVRSLALELFAAPAGERHQRVPLAEAAAFAEESLQRADIVFFALPLLLRTLVPPALLVLPGSVEVVVPLERALRWLREKRPPLGKYLRKIRAQQFHYTLEEGPAALGRFYQEYYLPYTRRRFGAAAAPRSWKLYRRFLRSMEILWVGRGTQRIAAYSAIRHDDRYRLLDLGYLDGDPRFLDLGASHALYACALQRADACGSARLDLGPVRPFLLGRDLQYKSQWGAELQTNPWAARLLAFGAHGGSPVAERFLRASPLVFADGQRRLWGITAGDPAAAAARFRTVGLAGSLPLEAALGRGPAARLR